MNKQFPFDSDIDGNIKYQCLYNWKVQEVNTVYSALDEYLFSITLSNVCFNNVQDLNGEFLIKSQEYKYGHVLVRVIPMTIDRKDKFYKPLLLVCIA